MAQEPTDNAWARHRPPNRARSWDWAASLGGPAMSVWRLERFKISTARADEGQVPLPETDRGQFSLVAWLQALLVMLLASTLWLGYLLYHRVGAGQTCLPLRTVRAVALHGEISTRTRHVLKALAGGAVPPVAAVILLGRVSQHPAHIRSLWAEALPDTPLGEVPFYLPMSPRAAFEVLTDLPRLVREGLDLAAHSTVRHGLRDEVAIAFRVFQGAVAAHWWAQNGTACEVIFGITGTADTTLLERAIQRSGGRSVHAVHGQATGPNFLGISDLALFRSYHDARAYAALGTYKRCSVQACAVTRPNRGSTGILLLSNLAHPMKLNFQHSGLRDETALLKAVGAVARDLGASAQPLYWKPHPVIASLPAETRDALRAQAANLGFEEVPADTPVEEVALASRWVVTSPSTVALDLLSLGCLSIVLDPQASVLDTALVSLPRACSNASSLTVLCRDLDTPDAYALTQARAYKSIGPARPLDFSVPLA